MKNILRRTLKEFDKDINSLPLSNDDIDFEEKISLFCFHCKNYNTKFTCPPRIPKLDYRNIIKNEYRNCLFIYLEMNIDSTNYSDVRFISTNRIHRALLHLEKTLFERNICTSLSLIGGSCKLCKTGCPSDKCNNPYLSRIPMEATGINVVSTAKKVGVDIVFPVTSSIYRCGMILW